MLNTFSNTAIKQPRTILTSQPTFERFIDLKAAAKLLQLHPDTVKKKVRDGEIPGRKVGRRWRFRVSELDAWARSGLVLPQPQSRRVI
jgi:excisionase family DNA binding protein